MVVTRALEEYLARAPEGHRAALEWLREAVISAAPDAMEVIRSGVPTFRYCGKPLVSIGAAQRLGAEGARGGAGGVRHLEHGGSIRSHPALAVDLVTKW